MNTDKYWAFLEQFTPLEEKNERICPKAEADNCIDCDFVYDCTKNNAPLPFADLPRRA